MRQFATTSDHASLWQNVTNALSAPADSAGILQGVRRLRQGVPHKRIAHVPSIKNLGRMVPCESRIESLYIQNLDIHPDVETFRTQPFELRGPNGGRVVPDVLIKFRNGLHQVVDIKPYGQLSDPDVKDRMLWVRQILANAGLPHRIVTEQPLEQEPAHTIRHQLLKARFTQLTPSVCAHARTLLANGPLPLAELRSRMESAGHPSLSVEKLVIEGQLSFELFRRWSPTTKIGDAHDTQPGDPDWRTIHAVVV